MNDQQRQYIAQAQQAISNSPIPQNTQLPQDINIEDDPAVMDILNNINNSGNGPSNQSESGVEQFQQQMLMQQMAAQQQQQMPMMAPQPYDSVMQNILLQQAQAQQSVPTLDYKSFVHHFSDDIKLASLIFAATIIIHFIPIQSIVGKYIAIQNIPYHEIILRAILVALLTIIVKKLMKI
jgi:hypothetical protein